MIPSTRELCRRRCHLTPFHILVRRDGTHLHRRTHRARPVGGRSRRRRVGRPVAHPADKIEYARPLKGEGATLGQSAAKTGIPKTSVHRYLDPTPARHDDLP
ncbi:MAG: hypothetical protein ACRDS0_31705 [Pseudonocardiaceae bacterium]